MVAGRFVHGNREHADLALAMATGIIDEPVIPRALATGDLPGGALAAIGASAHEQAFGPADDKTDIVDEGDPQPDMTGKASIPDVQHPPAPALPRLGEDFTFHRAFAL